MHPILRVATRPVRVPHRFPALACPSQPLRSAHQSYGNEQSGMQQGTEQKNPKANMEHPGPEAPANSKGGSSSTSGGGSPKIQSPKSAAEKDDPEVRKHNEELEQRHERTVNQLSEDDNKVDKQFWKGDVGRPSEDNK
ncbi:uncharacterized protein Z519_05276 [Cladophialophora bantiana CBS 173.52]|uniref:Uncharacterized protein n=1 Tax=Cladophialophora bantiana (strain ATCC 10958 / CBS 173.52 / CDC B-1940 / NIH 8579) TaxID=1442370 RepID=A0A0D2EVW0_CLAB1|nr:uncharacterized protein Z519_05276 [Cladophialophora bantiana CBS 173.52]KIW93961.1 hypothetical protein Z519_05276 [Cladophialophora bantiana CBS 173.52]